MGDEPAWGRYFYVQSGAVWLVIDAGTRHTKDFYPRIMATCEDKGAAETICDALDVKGDSDG